MFAGSPGFEPGRAVLETAMIPFHHEPKIIKDLLELRDPVLGRNAMIPARNASHSDAGGPFHHEPMFLILPTSISFSETKRNQIVSSVPIKFCYTSLYDHPCRVDQWYQD